MSKINQWRQQDVNANFYFRPKGENVNVESKLLRHIFAEIFYCEFVNFFGEKISLSLFLSLSFIQSLF